MTARSFGDAVRDGLAKGCDWCGRSLACRDTWGHVWIPGQEFCSRECLEHQKRAHNLCVGCDGENIATGKDGWCDECRNIAHVDGVQP